MKQLRKHAQEVSSSAMAPLTFYKEFVACSFDLRNIEMSEKRGRNVFILLRSTVQNDLLFEAQ